MKAGVTAAALFAFAGVAEADEPVAIVEDVSVGAPVTLFSYLLQGQIIFLDTDAEMQIGYLHSCVQEQVRGGMVTIGRERSRVDGGERTETVLDCRGATAVLTRSEIERGAVIVVRKTIELTPQLRLASASPFIAPRGKADSVSWKRLDRDEPATTVALSDGAADLSGLGVALDRGGIYRFEAGESSVIVEVAADARSGPGPILLRLLSF